MTEQSIKLFGDSEESKLATLIVQAEMVRGFCEAKLAKLPKPKPSKQRDKEDDVLQTRWMALMDAYMAIDPGNDELKSQILAKVTEIDTEQSNHSKEFFERIDLQNSIRFAEFLRDQARADLAKIK